MDNFTLDKLERFLKLAIMLLPIASLLGYLCLLFYCYTIGYKTPSIALSNAFILYLPLISSLFIYSIALCFMLAAGRVLSPIVRISTTALFSENIKEKQGLTYELAASLRPFSMKNDWQSILLTFLALVLISALYTGYYLPSQEKDFTPLLKVFLGMAGFGLLIYCFQSMCLKSPGQFLILPKDIPVRDGFFKVAFILVLYISPVMYLASGFNETIVSAGMKLISMREDNVSLIISEKYVSPIMEASEATDFKKSKNYLEKSKMFVFHGATILLQGFGDKSYVEIPIEGVRYRLDVPEKDLSRIDISS